MRLSSFVNLDRKGGSFQIMLQQLRRAVGVAIVSGYAKHKLRCLHCVQESAEEAANAVMQALLITSAINGTEDTIGIQAGMMLIHQMDTRNVSNFGMGSSLGCFDV